MYLKREKYPGMIGGSPAEPHYRRGNAETADSWSTYSHFWGPRLGTRLPQGRAFGGYQYVRLNPGGTNCQGFGGSAAGNLNDWFGVVGDFGYCKVTGLPSGTSAHAINYLFGPRVTYRSAGSFTPFAHVILYRKSTRINSSLSLNS